MQNQTPSTAPGQGSSAFPTQSVASPKSGTTELDRLLHYGTDNDVFDALYKINGVIRYLKKKEDGTQN